MRKIASSVYLSGVCLGMGAIAALFAGQVAQAQDSHYWTNQFGSRSALMGGAVVSGPRDSSAGFYNPGDLGFIDNGSLSVSGSLYQASTLTIDNGVGGAEDLKSTKIQSLPSLLSGVLKFKEAPEHTLGYSVLTKDSFLSKMTGRVDTMQDIIPEYRSAGDEEFIGQVTFQNNVREMWLGGSYAYKVSPILSLGASLFVPVRNQDGSEINVARVVTDAGELSSVTALSTLDYSNIRALGKFGASLDLSPLKIGLTVTTPSGNLFGTGAVARDITVTNVAIDGMTPLSFVGNDYQDEMDTTYKSPLSVALGAEYFIEQTGTTVALSAEYFDSVDFYAIMEPEERPFLRPSNVDFGVSSADFLRAYAGAESVTNFALAVEQKLTEKVNGYISFRTDRSSLIADDSAQQGFGPAFTPYDIYHVTLGGSYRTEQSSMSLGTNLSFGNNDDFEQVADFDSASETNLFAGETDRAPIHYRSIGLIVGYTYYF